MAGDAKELLQSLNSLPEERLLECYDEVQALFKRVEAAKKSSQKKQSAEYALEWSPQSLQFPRRTAKELSEEILELTRKGGDFTVHNYVAVIEDFTPESVLVETELFPRGAIEFYTAKNMGWPIAEDDTAKWLTPGRGGEQGDYREGMQKKIANVVDCLRTHPHSKRAIIPIPFATEGSANVSPPRIISLHAHVSRRALNAEQNQLTHNSQVDWTNAGQTKCCRELHLYIADGKLCCTGFLRVQNATIFPKNVHFFATLLKQVSEEISVPVGEYTHFISSVCHDRSATQC